MARELLSGRRASCNSEDHRWTLNFRFLESDYPGAVPSVRSDASPLGFPAGFVVESWDYEKTSSTDAATGAAVYKMTVTAIDRLFSALPFDDTDEAPNQFDEAESVYGLEQDDSGNRWVSPRSVRTKQRYIDRNNWFNNYEASERDKVGKINSATGDPITGCTAEEWMLIDIKISKKVSVGGRLKVTYFYERAPRNASGAQQTWTAYGTSTGATYTTGVIKWGI